MQTMVRNTPNKFGYIKCGEIFQSKQSLQDPYILRCIQCQEIYLLLESFILHFEEDCKKAGATKKRNRIAESSDDSTNEDEMEDEQPEVEKSSVKLKNKDIHMDPLIVKKEKEYRFSVDTEEPKIQENNSALEYCPVTGFQTQGTDDRETTVNIQDENESNDTELNEKKNNVHLEKRFKASAQNYLNTSQMPLASSTPSNERNQIRVATDLQMGSLQQSKNLHPEYLHGQTEYLQGQPHVKNEPHMDNDIISMLQSGSGFQMNFHTPPEDLQKLAHIENNQQFVRNYSAPDMGNMYPIDFHPPPDHYQGQQQMPYDQLYGKHYRGDLMIDIGNEIYCRKKILDIALGSSHKATHVARKLLDGVFKLETLLNCTLTGIAPRAQGRERMSQEVIQLDYKARSAIVDFAISTSEKKGWTPQSAKLIERAMSQRIGEIKRTNNATFFSQCIETPSNSNRASSAFVSNFMKSRKNVTVLITAYKKQPELWNKNMQFYGNKLKRREFMEQIAQDLNKNYKLNLNGSQVSAIVVHLYRKYQEDLQRVQEKDDYEDKNKKQYYITPWFLKQLEFIKPYLENYSLEILDTNLPNLLPEQIVGILEIYRGFSHLWNSNLIEHHCKNKRQETLNEMLKVVETEMNLTITEKVLEEYLRTIHNYFSREKRKILNNKKNKSNTKETSTSSNNNDYYERLMFLHDHVRPFRCSECGGEYINPLHFKMHKSSHDGTVPFSCSQCNKTFKRVNVYISHAKRHLEDLNYICKECGKKFITFTNLRLHMRIHTGDKPYCCEMCGESFRFLQTLSNHRRRHEKRYLHSCKICSKGFYSKIRHDDHMNSHMNIRSYICDICNKAFITKRALQQHKVVHEDIRKHACKLCGKTFKHRAGVNQHMKTHDIATNDDKSTL